MPKDKRPYITVTLDMPDHPKYAGLNRAQKMLLIEGWIHCAKYLTDGVMDIKVWNKFGTNRDRKSLLDCESVTTNPDGKSVLFVDYLEHQSSRSEVEAKREQARSAGQKGGRAKAAKSSGAPSEPLSEKLAPATHLFSDPSSGSVAEVEVEEEVEVKRTTTRRAPAKPDAPKVASLEQVATTAAYERVGKAFKYVAVLQIAKWAIHDRGVEPKALEDAIVAIYEAGKPITRQTVGQCIDGYMNPIHVQGRGIGAITRQDAKVNDYLERGQRLANAARMNTQKEIS